MAHSFWLLKLGFYFTVSSMYIYTFFKDQQVAVLQTETLRYKMAKTHTEVTIVSCNGDRIKTESLGTELTSFSSYSNRRNH